MAETMHNITSDFCNFAQIYKMKNQIFHTFAIISEQFYFNFFRCISIYFRNFVPAGSEVLWTIRPPTPPPQWEFFEFLGKRNYANIY